MAQVRNRRRINVLRAIAGPGCRLRGVRRLARSVQCAWCAAARGHWERTVFEDYCRNWKRRVVCTLGVALAALTSAACGGISFNSGEGCSVGGQKLEVGDSLDDGCNTCSCEKGGNLACTLADCDVDVPGEGDPCEVEDGVWLSDGATRTADCESCSCDDGKLSCEQVCEPTEPADCELDRGEVIEHGERFEVSCNTCRCDDGAIECTEMACNDDRCELDGDDWLEDGDTFELGCNECECDQGTLRCTNRDCEDPAQCVVDGDRYDDGDEVPSGRSCESCVCDEGEVFCLEIGCAQETCEYDGRTYADGDLFNDDCNVCQCDGGRVSCTEKACGPASCEYEGNVYQDGEVFEDACNECSCEDGQVSCTDMACACEVDGESYQDGDTVPSDRSCESCFCDNGDVACVSIGCQSCVYDGDEYDEGDTFSGADACTTCTCANGEVRCDFSGCPDPVCDGDGGPLPNGSEVDVDGQACQCVDGEAQCLAAGSCEVRGVVYENGSSVPDPDSCNQCSCVDGVITACTEIACPLIVIEPCPAGRDSSEDYVHDAVAIDDGLLNIEVSGACQGFDEFDVCYDPISTTGSTPETELHLIQNPVDDCSSVGTRSLVVDLYPFTSEEGFEEVFFDIGRHRLLYVAP